MASTEKADEELEEPPIEPNGSSRLQSLRPRGNVGTVVGSRSTVTHPICSHLHKFASNNPKKKPIDLGKKSNVSPTFPAEFPQTHSIDAEETGSVIISTQNRLRTRFANPPTSGNQSLASSLLSDPPNAGTSLHLSGSLAVRSLRPRGNAGTTVRSRSKSNKSKSNKPVPQTDATTTEESSVLRCEVLDTAIQSEPQVSASASGCRRVLRPRKPPPSVPVTNDVPSRMAVSCPSGSKLPARKAQSRRARNMDNELSRELPIPPVPSQDPPPQLPAPSTETPDTTNSMKGGAKKNRTIARMVRLVERRKDLPQELQNLDTELVTQTIKSGLYNMLREGEDKQAISERIEADVCELSDLAIEFSHYIHFLVYRALNDGKEDELTNLDFRELINHLCVKPMRRGFVRKGGLDEEYDELRKSCGIRTLYNAEYRSQLIQKIADQYKENFTTNLTSHSYDRVKRCLRIINKKAKNLEDKLKDTMDFLSDPASETENLLNFPDGCSWTRGSLRESQYASKCMNFIKDFYRIQKVFEIREVKNFRLVPLCKAGRKHMLYDKRAFLGLIRAIGRVPSGMNNETLFQQQYDFKFHFNLATDKVMGTSFSTDSVSICVHYEKIGVKKVQKKEKGKKRKKEKKEKNKPTIPLENYHRFIGIDPGLRLFIAATELEDTTETSKFRSVKYFSKDYHKDAGFGKRRNKLLNWTGEMDKKIERDRKQEVERLKNEFNQNEENDEEVDGSGESEREPEEGEESAEEGNLSAEESGGDDESESSESEPNPVEEENSDDEGEESDEEDDLPEHPTVRIEANSPTFYRNFIQFRLKWLKKKLKKYRMRKIARLKLDKDMQTNSIVSRFIAQHFVKERFDPSGSRNMYAVFLGDNMIPANSPIRGYRRVPNSLLVKKLKENKNVHLYLIDEYNTTKLCSKCFRPLIILKNKHRYSVCQNCKLVWNRDLNASNSIARLGIQELRGETRQREFDRDAPENKRKGRAAAKRRRLNNPPIVPGPTQHDETTDPGYQTQSGAISPRVGNQSSSSV